MVMSSNQTLYIIVSPNGAIGRYLVQNISAAKESVSITWKQLCLLLNSNSFLDFLAFHRARNDYISIVVIYCSAVQSSESKELQILKRIVEPLCTDKKDCQTRLIYFSTYEPQKYASTKYRKIKAAAEAYLSKHNQIYIRVGIFSPEGNRICETNPWQQSQNVHVVASYMGIPLYMPVTSGAQLVDKILNNDFMRPECYTSYLVYCASFRGISTADCEYVGHQILFSVSYLIRYAAKISLLVSQFVPSLSWLAPVHSFLQKPASLLDHQRAFREVNHI